MAYQGKTPRTTPQRKARIFKVLNYDPELSVAQISQRFGMHYNTAALYRQEWKALRGIS